MTDLVLSIFKANAADKRDGFAFEGYVHGPERHLRGLRVMFKNKADARAYAVRNNLKPWNF